MSPNERIEQTAAYLLEKYGPLLTRENLAEVLHVKPNTITKRLANGVGTPPSSREGDRPLWHYKDVALDIDGLRKRRLPKRWNDEPDNQL